MSKPDPRWVPYQRKDGWGAVSRARRLYWPRLWWLRLARAALLEERLPGLPGALDSLVDVAVAKVS